MSNDLTKEFGLLRSLIWPIRRDELKKFIPMFIMLFLICFNYGILRSMKDSILITTSGAKVLPFIKIWGILPMTIGITYILSKLNSRFSLERVFYIMTSGFLIYFVLFAFVIYPYRDSLHPYASAQVLENFLPKGFAGLAALYKHWTLTLFYVLSELWCSFILSTLFWGFANSVIPIKVAKRYFGVLTIGSNSAALVSGLSANFFSKFAQGSWDGTIQLLLMIVVACGFMTMLLFKWLNVRIFTEKNYPQLHQKFGVKKKKKRPSLKESFAFLGKSKYLVYLTTLLVAYNLSIGLFEIIWKDYLHKLCDSPIAFNHYMNNVTAIVGLVSLIVTVFIPYTLERIGWTRMALITPITMAVTGFGFFAFLFIHKFFGANMAPLFSLSPLAIAVFFGAAQSCLSKAAKYSVFDTTKELAFVPLDPETRMKSKAPIEAVAARFGKFGGSFVFQGLLLGCGTLSACIPYITVLLTFVIGFWMTSVKNLGLLFNRKVAEQESAEPMAVNEATTT